MPACPTAKMAVLQSLTCFSTEPNGSEVFSILWRGLLEYERP